MNPQDVVFLFLFLKFKVQRIRTRRKHYAETSRQNKTTSPNEHQEEK